MRTVLPFFAAIVLVAGPALGQSQGGGGGSEQGGPPGGFPGERGNSSLGALDQEFEKNRLGLKYAENPNSKRAKEARLFEAKVVDFEDKSALRKAEALALGVAARRGEPVAESAGAIRAALEQDLEEWRNAFNIARKDWRTVHDQMLADEGDLSPAEWAVRRASWFQARDQWIKQEKERRLQ